MKHIRQINSVGTQSYTIMVVDDWDRPLEEHPSIIQHPEVFEIVDADIPENAQYLKYA